MALLEPDTVGADGKFQFLLIGGRTLTRVDAREFIDTSVESGAQLVKKLAKFERDGAGERSNLFDGDASCPVVIDADVRGVRLLFDKRVPQSRDGIAMGVRSPNALPTIVEWLAHE